MNISVSKVIRGSFETSLGVLLITAGFSVFMPTALAGTLAAPPVVNGWVQVSTLNQLVYIDENQSSVISAGSNTTYLNAHIELMNDIDLTDYSGWLPFGGNSSAPFGGVFNGQGFTIQNLTVNNTTGNEAGLFGSNTGTVENIGLVNVSVTGPDFPSPGDEVGGLVGLQIDGVIQDAYVNGVVQNDSYSGGNDFAVSVGGLVGEEDGGLIQNAYSTATVSQGTDDYLTGGTEDFGGAVGLVSGGTMRDVYATGQVSTGQRNNYSGTAVHFGGLVGELGNGSINNSYFDTDATGQSLGVGNNSSASGVTGESTPVMQTESTYTSAGWDFVKTWGISSSINNGYPYLKQPTAVTNGGGGPVPPFINTVSFMEDAKVGTPYSAQLVTTGGTQPFTWSVTNGALPQGLTLSNQGVISGSPIGLGGQYTFTVQVTDANHLKATRQLVLTVDGPTSYPSIATTSLAPDTVGQPYDQTLMATGGTAPYEWHIAQGTLPTGLSFNSNTGEITGAATTSGVSNITVQVTDAGGMISTQTLPIDIIKSDEREIVWNGQIQNVPAVVGNEGGTQTTYMPIWYVMQWLKSMDIQSTWNGHQWQMTSSSQVDLTNVQAGSGNTSIYLNGTLVQNVNTKAVVDPSSGKPTTYMPIWYVEQILNQVGLTSTWDGMTWTVTPSNS
ncbi:putative Ig domain-containing protein [Alicyclobacillus fodiniaquatilis]|uniref:Ig domain-containing protein n=1 Tax=Alicyclobacillus fodiniaquatilis TaxID=1661150 RepID=A0ABW4JCD2_9BACL